MTVDSQLREKVKKEHPPTHTPNQLIKLCTYQRVRTEVVIKETVRCSESRGD